MRFATRALLKGLPSVETRSMIERLQKMPPPAEESATAFLEKQLSTLEGAVYASFFFKEFEALKRLITSWLQPHDKLLLLSSHFSKPSSPFHSFLKSCDIELHLLDPYAEGRLSKAFEIKPQLLLIETPDSETLSLYDLHSIIKEAKRWGVKVIVDNTVATPYFQNPLKWGAHIVLHRSLGYLSGLEGIQGEVMMTDDPEFKRLLDVSKKSFDQSPSSFLIWALSQGVKTLAVRMEAQAKAALSIAKFLSNHAKVKKVYYPGLPDYPQRALAEKQLYGFGSTLCAQFNFTNEEIEAFVKKLKYFSLTSSFGGARSSLSQVLSTKENHASLRFQIGLEDEIDLIEDLASALG